MKSWSLLGSLALFSGLLLYLALNQSRTPSNPSARIDELFVPSTLGKRPGAAVMVVQSGKVLHKKGYGLADLNTNMPFDDNTNIRLASVSKQFTAMGVMILAERGKLSYDDRLAKFFPEFLPCASEITIRQLLHHTSGLLDHEKLFTDLKLIDSPWPRFSKTPVAEFEPTALDSLNLLARQRFLKFLPGTRFEYSNSGYVILACIIEKVSGTSYDRFLKAAIFEPLGMSSTVVADGRHVSVKNCARTYLVENDEFRDVGYTPFDRIYGDDGVYSSLADLERWLPALKTDRLVGLATLEKATTPGRLCDGEETPYGFGLFLEQRLGMRTIGHMGIWAGAQTCIMDYGPGKLTVVILTNRDDFNCETLADKVAMIYLKDE